jgi:PEP-CTERM motif
MRIQAFAMGLALALATVGGARATEVQFTITGGDRTATFELALSPTPNPALLDYSFSITSVSAVVGGSPTPIATLTFYQAGMPGGGFLADSLFNFLGPQFYSGSENSPTFIPGVYKGLVNDFTGKTDTVTVKELPTTVSDPPPITVSNPPPVTDPPDPPAIAVPEPSTWAMLLLGFLSLGYAGYRKARTRTIN